MKQTNKLHKGECPQCGEYKMHTPGYYLFIGGILVALTPLIISLVAWAVGMSATTTAFIISFTPLGVWVGIVMMIISPFATRFSLRVCENCTWVGIPGKTPVKVIKKQTKNRRDTLIK